MALPDLWCRNGYECRQIKNADGDSARFCFLCEDCQKKVERIGGEMPNEVGAVIVHIFFLAHVRITAIMPAPGDARKV